MFFFLNEDYNRAVLDKFKEENVIRIINVLRKRATGQGTKSLQPK